MHFKNDAEVNELVRSFETCEIHPAEFKHYQHLAVALWYVKNCSYAEAGEKMRQGIQRLAAAYGKTGYHETITLFWLAAVRGFYANEEAGESLCSLANKLVDRYGDNKNLIANYYSEAALAAGKNVWVEPDVRRFEFEK